MTIHKKTATPTADDIASHLRGDAKEIKLEVFEALDSTNTYLKELAPHEKSSMCAVIAQTQTAGRGRLGRSFASPPCTGLYMSLLLHPQLAAEETSLLTTMTAVAVCETIEELSDEKPAIKWVNDIFCRGKKVCGILTEAAFSAESGLADYAVIGMGVNLLEPEGGFPPELAEIAGSVFGTGSMDGDIRCRFAAELLNRLTERIKETPRAHIDEYRSRCFVLGKEVEVITPREIYPATAIGLDDDCGLIIRLADGSLRTIFSGEISVRPLR